MVRRDDFVEYLRRVPLFSACTKRDLRFLATCTEKVLVPAGRTVIDEGRLGREFFTIVDGTARVIRNGRRVADLGPGDSFGELALLDRAPRNASVAATSDLELLVLTRDNFVKIVDDAPAFARALLLGLARRLREADSG